MKILKRILNIGENKIFNKNGEFIMNNENCMVIDVILTILAAKDKVKSLDELRLEVLRCGILIPYPEFKQCIKYLENEGLITSESPLVDEFSEN